jgi:hypothetical protein
MAVGKTNFESALKNTMKAHRKVGLSPRRILIGRGENSFSTLLRNTE